MPRTAPAPTGTPSAARPPGPASPIPAGTDRPGQVLRQFRILFNAVRSHFQQVERKSGLGASQVWALGEIRQNPGIGVTQLASRMDIHQTTTSNLVRLLAERGLVRVERKGADRRTVQLFLEPAGVRLLRKVPGPFTGVLPAALEQLDARTLARLDRDLERLIGLVQADRRAGRKPLADM